MTRPDTKSLGIVCCLLLTLSSCGPVETPAEPAALFVDVSVDVGLDFTHDNGMSGEKYIAEMMGPGGAFLDFDNDGDLDIYLPQGRPLNPGTSSGSSGTDRLFRNDLVVSPDGSRSFGFTDVSVEAGLTPPTGYTFGVATGDYDGDGWIDLYLTQLGTNQLLRNNGDGTFSDRTEAAGVADLRMSMPAAFFDFDGDRRLDLYVGNYLDFRVATHKRCFSPSGRSDYCGPLAYNPLPDRLFRNTGDGTFEDVTRRAGLAESRGNALGVVITDFDLDGRHGLFVANDTGENFLWRNLGDGRFQEQALIAGCALNGNGEPEGSMGVEVADLDGDGDEDIFLTHMSQETNTLYLNGGTGLFDDGTIASGLGTPSWEFTGFGMISLDYDNDGQLDIAVANGEIKTIDAHLARGDPFPLHQTNQLFRNLGEGRFEEVTAIGGEVFLRSEVTRGLAVGDVDNDGDADILWINNHGPTRLLLNQVGSAAHWLGVRAVEGDPARDALGARVGIQRSDGSWVWHRVRVAGSYLSSSDPRVLFGLGDQTVPSRIRVQWTGGQTEEWPVDEYDRYVVVRRGEGTVVTASR